MALKVLIVTYYWPPAGGPGVQRWLKFVKYLPEFDVEPVVFIPENANYPIIDTSLENEISAHVTIIKFPIKEPYGLASAFSRKQTKTISSGILPKKEKQSLLQKAMLYVRGNFFIPDARVGWVKPSVRFLEDYLAQNDVNTIITTGPPHSVHLIGQKLKTENPNIHWIADFRDPWTTIGYHDKLRMTAKTKELHKKLEKDVLNGADQIVVTSRGTKEEFQNITKSPIHVITNGFDSEIMSAQVPSVDAKTFTLGHFGSLLSDRNPTILWEVLGDLINENSDFARAFRLKLAGKVSQEVLDSIEKYQLNNNLDVLGYIPHNEIFEYYKNTDVLLLIEINARHTKAIIPGKLFEYLAARKPILAIGPKGSDVEEIITKTEAGSYFAYTQKETLKEYILNKFLNRKVVFNSNSEAISKYHRKPLTATLAGLLKSEI